MATRCRCGKHCGKNRDTGIGLFLSACVLCTPQVDATVYNSNGTAASVQALHNVASNGDTISVPQGTFTWTSGVTLTKSITLQGAGIGCTIIRDAVNTAFLQSKRKSAPLICWNYSAIPNARPRLTGIEFQHGGRTPYIAGPTGLLNFVGSSINGARFRMDNCYVNDINGVISFWDVLGVVDHTTFYQATHTAHFTIIVYNQHWLGMDYANGSWQDDPHFGSEQWLFFEDCTFFSNYDYVSAFADGYRGARYVVRYCTLYHKMVQTHGTDSGSYPSRGSRACEVYNNTIIGHPSSNTPAYIRGGTWVIHDNAIRGFHMPQAKFVLVYDRAHGDFSNQTFGGANGQSAFDVNKPGGPFLTGTAAATTTRNVVTVSGGGLTPNEFVGYAINRTSNLGNLDTCHFATITANDTDTITYPGGFFCKALTFTAGDTFEIYKVEHGLDQPGRGGGTFVRGNPPQANGPNDQTTQPCYEWNNGSVHFGPQEKVIRANEHYFNSTVMPGYAPFTYPHPLTVDTRSPTPMPTATPRPSPTPTATARATRSRRRVPKSTK